MSTTLYPKNTQNNFTTGLSQSPMASTIFYENTKTAEQSLYNDVLSLHDQIYQIIAVFIIVQSIVLFCLIYYCHRQSKEMKGLSLKIDSLISNNQYQTIPIGTLRSHSPPTISVNTPIPATPNEDDEDDAFISPYKNATLSPQTHNVRPWAPKTANATSLPPPKAINTRNNIKKFTSNTFAELNKNPLHQTVTPSNSMCKEEGGNNISLLSINMTANETVWSGTAQEMNAMVKGQSALSVESVTHTHTRYPNTLTQQKSTSINSQKCRDSVLGEMLGLNDKKQISDADTVIIIDDEDVEKETNASGSYHL